MDEKSSQILARLRTQVAITDAKAAADPKPIDIQGEALIRCNAALKVIMDFDRKKYDK